MHLVPCPVVLICTSYHNAPVRPHNSSSGINIAIWISLAALLVSVTLPLLLDARQSPRVIVRIGRSVHFDHEWNATEFYMISAINHGRSEVQINQVDVSYTTRSSQGEEVFLTFLDFAIKPDLPYTLAPYANTSFSITREQVDQKLDTAKKCRLYGSLRLSNGYRAVSRRAISLGTEQKMHRRHPRLKRIKIFVFAKEKERW